MGGRCFRKMKINSIKDFSLIEQVGSGHFSKVFKAQDLATGEIFAVKKIPVSAYNEGCRAELKNERKISSLLKSPFIVTYLGCFSDENYVYLLYEFLAGGNLRRYIEKRHLTEPECKFIIACCVEALGYLLSCSIIHRDIKPENLVFDLNGYIRLIDFGISQQYSSSMKLNRQGTLGYLAPEILFGQNYGYSSDYFSLGVIAYEMIERKKPFGGKSCEEAKDSYIESKIHIENPYGFSQAAVDFAEKILVKNSNNRLGLGGIEEIRAHDWLSDVDWQALRLHKVKSPCTDYL